MPPRKGSAPPKKGNDLVTAQHELVVAEEAMSRLQDPNRNVRQRAERISEQEDRIKIIKSRIQHLQNSVPTLAAATILGSLSNDIGKSFTPGHIKREALDFVMSDTGPGTQDMPMEVDDDDHTNDRINHEGLAVRDERVDGTEDSANFVQKEFASGTQELPEQDQYLSAINDVTGRCDHTVQSTSVNELSLDEGQGDNQNVPIEGTVADSQTVPQKMADLEMSPGSDHNLNDCTGAALTMAAPSPVANSQTVPQEMVDLEMTPRTDHNLNDCTGAALTMAAPSPVANSQTVVQEEADSEMTLIHPESRILREDPSDWMGGGCQGSSNGDVRGEWNHEQNDMGDKLSGSPAFDAVMSGHSWRLDLTTCKNEVYSFELQDCNDQALTSRHIPGEEGDTDTTTPHHRNAVLLQAQLDHYDRQLASLLEQQQDLVKSMSKGFEGDMGTTVEHIAAISKSVKDIQTLEALVSEHRVLAKEGRHIYLTFANQEDQRKVGNLKAKVQVHLERLTIIDPELLDLQLEQKSIREAQAKISVLQDGIKERTDELALPKAYAFKDDNTGQNNQDYEDIDRDGTLHVTRKDTAPPDAHNTQSSTERGKKKGKAPKKKSATGSMTGPQAFNAMIGLSDKSEDFIKAEKEGLKALKAFVKDGGPTHLTYTLRNHVRTAVGFLLHLAVFTMDTIPLIFESKSTKLLSCEYHRNNKNFKADTVIELTGMGFKGGEASVQKDKQDDRRRANSAQSEGPSSSETSVASQVKPPLLPGHLHCGCPAAEVALDFFLWKTTRAFSSNPQLAGRVYQSTRLHFVRPSIRTYWNQSLRDYTGLRTEDFFGFNYGNPSYAMRIGLIQLHTQIERLKLLGAPVNIAVDFRDRINFSGSDHLISYNAESGIIPTASDLEDTWKDIVKRQVVPLPMLSVDLD